MHLRYPFGWARVIWPEILRVDRGFGIAGAQPGFETTIAAQADPRSTASAQSLNPSAKPAEQPCHEAVSRAVWFQRL